MSCGPLTCSLQRGRHQRRGHLRRVGLRRLPGHERGVHERCGSFRHWWLRSKSICRPRPAPIRAQSLALSSPYHQHRRAALSLTAHAAAPAVTPHREGRRRPTRAPAPLRFLEPHSLAGVTSALGAPAHAEKFRLLDLPRRRSVGPPAGCRAVCARGNLDGRSVQHRQRRSCLRTLAPDRRTGIVARQVAPDLGDPDARQDRQLRQRLMEVRLPQQLLARWGAGARTQGRTIHGGGWRVHLRLAGARRHRGLLVELYQPAHRIAALQERRDL